MDKKINNIKNISNIYIYIWLYMQCFFPCGIENTMEYQQFKNSSIVTTLVGKFIRKAFIKLKSFSLREESGFIPFSPHWGAQVNDQPKHLLPQKNTAGWSILGNVFHPWQKYNMHRHKMKLNLLKNAWDWIPDRTFARILYQEQALCCVCFHQSPERQRRCIQTLPST